MIFRFCSGSIDPGERRQERSGGVDHLELDAGGGDEVLLDLLGLALAQQPVVDEDAGEAVADGPLHERRGDRRVDAAGQPADGPAVADLLPDPRHLLLDDVDAWSRSGRQPASLEEAGQHRRAVRGVQDLGVELDAEQPVRHVLERSHRGALRSARSP